MLLLTLAACLLAAATGEGAAPDGRKPNVLFLVSDDLRPELGCYGNQIIQSPNIDRLASRSVVFDRAYCQQAVCSPSRTSVLTGARPDTTRVWDLTTHFRKALPDVVTLPQHFKEHGYVTVGLGKIYHGGLDDTASWSAPPKERGAPASRATGPRRPAPPAPQPVRSGGRGPAFRASDDPPNSGGEGALADEAIAALRRLKEASQPFFLAVGFRKPHLPFVSPKAYWDLYHPATIPLADNPFLPKGAPAFALADRNELWSYRDVPDASHLPDAYARQLKHGYYAAVSYMDAQLGRVLEELDRTGLSENTIVVLWGDHGWKLGEHDRWCKHSNVEDDARAPLIVAAPGAASSERHCGALVEFVDIYPTLAELAGLPLPTHLEGTSLRPLLENPDQAWKPAAFSQYPRSANGRRMMGYSMRTDRYRFTRWVDRDDHSKVYAVELYDHQTDPQENTNLADDPSHQSLVSKLTKQWEAGCRGARSFAAQE
ncbi:Choline-sulfatase [Pirellulimonas nuda]|uniref:Choline-sulfatase n=2 Tax=Pirellulimonas nuda TaxID=2528009 RepID=A0A518DBL5_9BACT|nr:Choline-sulfatase [Pirellulimonas nuda]